MPRILAFMEGHAQPGSQAEAWLSTVLERGLEALIAEAEEAVLRGLRTGRDSDRIAFFRALQEVLTGVLAYAANLRQFASLLADSEPDEERRHQLRTMAEVCAQVPAGPARTFREAVNAVWLMQIALHAGGSSQVLDLDRLGVLLYPWFRQDLDRGDMAADGAMELLGCLCLKLREHVGAEPASWRGSSALRGDFAPVEDPAGALGLLVALASEWAGLRETGGPKAHRGGSGIGSFRRAMEALAGTWAPSLFRFPGAESCRSISITP